MNDFEQIAENIIIDLTIGIKYTMSKQGVMFAESIVDTSFKDVSAKNLWKKLLDRSNSETKLNEMLSRML